MLWVCCAESSRSQWLQQGAVIRLAEVLGHPPCTFLCLCTPVLAIPWSVMLGGRRAGVLRGLGKAFVKSCISARKGCGKQTVKTRKLSLKCGLWFFFSHISPFDYLLLTDFITFPILNLLTWVFSAFLWPLNFCSFRVSLFARQVFLKLSQCQ